MYELYSHCVFNLNPRACSIDTPLHTFVPRKHVDHLHPNAVIAIAASVDQERLCREIYGDDVIYVPWQRPGLRHRPVDRVTDPGASQGPKGVLLGHHGMSSWGDDDKVCYETALEIIDRAAAYIEERDRGEKTFGGPKYRPLADEERRRFIVEIIPWLRGQVSAGKRLVATVQDDPKILRFVGQRRRTPPGEPGHLLSGPLPAHEDQAAVRRVEPREPRPRGPQGLDHRRASMQYRKTTRPTTSAASVPIRRRCAIPTRPWC